MILFFKPIFKERLWGKDNLKKEFAFAIPSSNTAEAWLISGHQNGQTEIVNTIYQGYKLNDFYQEFRNEFFAGDKSPNFPLLIKILDANDKLSIQVHPDDDYAIKNENDLGKTECWYVLGAETGATIIKGHNALTKDEFLSRLDANDLSLFKYVSVKKGDFHFIKSRTVHAINQGIMIYEIQQSSDSTYRLYDYNRKNPDGSLRELHLDKALDVIDFPEVVVEEEITTENEQDYKLQNLTSNSYFSVKHIDVITTYEMRNESYQLVTVLKGMGHVNNDAIKKGDSFIVTYDTRTIRFSGDLELIITSRTKTSKL